MKARQLFLGFVVSTTIVLSIFILGGVGDAARGYLTTPEELASIRSKVQQSLEPYASSAKMVMRYAGDATFWPFSVPQEISGEQSCHDTRRPVYIASGGQVVYAKALAYHLTGNEAYASEVRRRLLDLTDTTGYGGDRFSGGNQCILNLAWYMPAWIWAADLIEDYPGWTPEDKGMFQRWLVAEVYRKTSWASDARINNWGSAASYTSAAIADYLHDGGLELVDWNGTVRTASEAFTHHNAQQFHRMNGTQRMDSRCPVYGIQAHGGIPDELRRGSSGCEAQWIKDIDASWSYTQVHLEGTVAHAELLYRRGDPSMYENIRENGMGSILRAIHFVIDNPGRSADWANTHMPTLEVAYRYYRSPAICAQLRCSNVDGTERYIGTPSGQLLHFGTITHGFAPGENPGPPPMVSPP